MEHGSYVTVRERSRSFRCTVRKGRRVKGERWWDHTNLKSLIKCKYLGGDDSEQKQGREVTKKI